MPVRAAACSALTLLFKGTRCFVRHPCCHRSTYTAKMFYPKLADIAIVRFFFHVYVIDVLSILCSSHSTFPLVARRRRFV